jgi:hypothetical protein
MKRPSVQDHYGRAWATFPTTQTYALHYGVVHWTRAEGAPGQSIAGCFA